MGSKDWLRENLQETPKKHRKINGLLLNMAIEKVDFPIKKKGELSIVFCMFTIGYQDPLAFFSPIFWAKVSLI
jgi:hypothetical protein